MSGTTIFSVLSRTFALPLVFACLVPLVSCDSGITPSGVPQPGAPGPGSPTVALGVSARCFGPFRPGEQVSLACVVFVQEATGPASTGIGVHADLSQFGGPADALPVKCPACGDPLTYDLDLRVPADMAPGAKVFAIWATDAQGRRADGSASIEIAAR